MPGQTRTEEKFSLTKREQDVLELLAFGLSNKEIAQRLGLSGRTVETHVDHLLGKFGVPSRGRVVIEAARAGLLGRAPAAAPVPTLEARPNNLPFQLTTLLGRDEELIELKALLEGRRLLTLTGSGGVGKTRLALRVGVDLIGVYPDGIWVCDFSPITDPSLVVKVVAHALGLQEQFGHALAEAVASWLKRKRALLILDNCEHVSEPAAELVEKVLRASADVRVLATSRQALGITGEVVYRVSSLAVPNVTTGLTADVAMRYGAIALFVDRARSSDTRFAITDDNALLVAEICRRVDGIPLAIELAATRVSVTSLQSLAQSLDDRFRVLTDGSRTALPRQQTMRATLDWSYDLLEDGERTLLRRLGVFAGTWSLEATERVCTDAQVGRVDVPDALSALVRKSLVISEIGADVRFRLLESTRAYALDKLELAGELQAFTRRHTEWVGALADAWGERFYEVPQAQWMLEVAPEVDNIRLALKRCIEDGNDVPLGARILAGTAELWLNSVAEGCRYAETGLSGIDEKTDFATAGRFHYVISRLPVGRREIDEAQRAAAIFEASGDRIGLSRALRELAFALLRAGSREESVAPAERSLKILNELGLDHSVDFALSLNRLGTALLFSGRAEQARSAYERAIVLFDSLHDAMRAGFVRTNLAELEFAQGNAQTALNLATQLLPLFDTVNSYTRSMLFRDIAAYNVVLGRLDDAAANSRLALREAERCQSPVVVALAMFCIGAVAGRRGEVERSARLLGYALKQLRIEGYEIEPVEQKIHELVMGVLREQLPQDQLAALLAEGSSLHTEDATTMAQTLESETSVHR